MINNSFNVIGKKNNQTSVSDADQEIPTLGSTDNAENLVNFISGIICLPSGCDFWSASVTMIRFYLSWFCWRNNCLPLSCWACPFPWVIPGLPLATTDEGGDVTLLLAGSCLQIHLRQQQTMAAIQTINTRSPPTMMAIDAATPRERNFSKIWLSERRKKIYQKQNQVKFHH